MRVFTSTTGLNLDPDGYVVSLDGRDQQRLGPGDTFLFQEVPAGDHSVELGDLAESCASNGSATRTVTISPGGETVVRFRIACTGTGIPPEVAIVFGSNRDGPTALDADVYTARSDGELLVNLTDQPGVNFDPAWSPDGTQLAFVSDREDDDPEIYVMDAADGETRRLTRHVGADVAPVWSPDGTKIAFQRSTDSAEFAQSDIFVMDADGSAVMPLTVGVAADRSPSWSPNGTKIVFERDVSTGGIGLFVVELSTLLISRIDTPPDIENARWPAWSMSGAGGEWIAFGGRILSEGNLLFDIWIIRPDGTEPRKVVEMPGTQLVPTWTPDGRILFNSG
ncbi:MAG: hypothetical protein ACE5HP_12940, partial [Gemmatimonadota bacterium]